MNSQGKNILIGLTSILLVLGSLWVVWKMTSSPSALTQDQAPKNIQITEQDHIKGDISAPITLVEYSDFQCPACKLYAATVKSVVDANPDVRLVYRDFPLEQHKNAQVAATAAHAAGKQGKFFEFHDLLFENQDKWQDISNPRDTFSSYAKTLKLNVDTFKKDMDSKEISAAIDVNYQSGIQIGVDSTPSFYLDGVRIKPNSAADFQTLIDSARAKKKPDSTQTGTPSGDITTNPVEVNK